MNDVINSSRRDRCWNWQLPLHRIVIYCAIVPILRPILKHINEYHILKLPGLSPSTPFICHLVLHDINSSITSTVDITQCLILRKTSILEKIGTEIPHYRATGSHIDTSHKLLLSGKLYLFCWDKTQASINLTSWFIHFDYVDLGL